MAVRIINFMVMLVANRFIFGFPFLVREFFISFAKRGASALSPEMRLRLVVGVRMLLGSLVDGCWVALCSTSNWMSITNFYCRRADARACGDISPFARQ
jgi:hypothetical protein